VRGEKPKELGEVARITARQWETYQNHLTRESPILTGLRYLKVFEQDSINTYAKAAEVLGVSRVRVFQLTALVTKLSGQITQYLVEHNNDPAVRRYFTERRLRPLTTLPSKEEQVAEFQEMLKNLELSTELSIKANP
jgi:RNase adaptor protein for sRNA GlmZ degradation